MQYQRCAARGVEFRPRPQNRGQRYCANESCQGERRRRWKREKRRSDADYRDNQGRAQRAWSSRHPSYWREYRGQHPEYLERNRQQQRLRNARRGARVVASAIAKGNAWTVTINAVSVACVATQ